ncbi:class E sortase [Streptomyces bambusae]|uniref:Sortase n=1 Tax=Streptomyces bambusae TaxID=1550616 RepID=A0ABS6Z9F1_9ACTN|nr:class E sortase [Streptomyces bambusae]MBW5484201.1 sortase [Streptomyces bambusae]
MPLPFSPAVLPAAVAGAAATVLLAACTSQAAVGATNPTSRAAAPAPPASASASAPASATAAAPTSGPAAGPATPTAYAPAVPEPSATAPAGASRATEASTLSIPSVGIAGLRVMPYEGTTDDAPGTRIQDLGVAASPYGKAGGVGPGQVGNFLVTAHRLSAGGPLRELPAVDEGDSVLVTAGGMVYTYEIVATRSTSFRSERSLTEQRAAVPGQPGATATQAMITISTCATPEDHARGNFWSDAQGNPEHRIDKIGVLRGTSAAG